MKLNSTHLLRLAIGLLLLSPLAGKAQSTTFNFTGGPQMFVVPQGCNTAVQVDAFGAEGGGNSVAAGGMGGHTQATIPVTPGETLYVYVGGTGDVNGPAGYNGGGTGIGGSPGNPGSGGGGASDVRKSGNTLADRWVVAGGGGGGTENGGVAVGGAGGGLIGGSANPGGNPWGCTPLVVATGGTQSAGGLGGTSVSCAWDGFNGAFGQGGNSHNNYRSSGGGGGWYGGGGAHNGTSGAGGSSYAHPSATSVTHIQGARTGNGMVVLTLIQSVPVNLGPDTLACNGYVLNAGHPGNTYLWSNNATSQTISVTNSGTYSVIVTDSSGCTGTDSVTINVVPAPIVNLGADTSICVTATLDAGNAGSTYLWSTNATTQSIVVAAGTYAVTVTNGAGCTGSDSITLTQAPSPIVNLGGALTGCDSLILDAGNPGQAYLWNTGATTQTLLVTASGIYEVTVTQVGGCQFEAEDSVVVTLGSTSNVSFQGLDSTYCTVDGPVTLSGIPAGGTFSGTGISGNIFNPTQAGIGLHTITYTFSDSLGCTGTAVSTTLVDVCFGISDNFLAEWVLYPNPNNGKFSIQGLPSEATIEVFNVLGVHVLTVKAEEAKVDLDLTQNGSGVYLIEVFSNGSRSTQRVVVQ